MKYESTITRRTIHDGVTRRPLFDDNGRLIPQLKELAPV
jgi:hypothetical protein